jgi:hypothetical protein
MWSPYVAGVFGNRGLLAVLLANSHGCLSLKALLAGSARRSLLVCSVTPIGVLKMRFANYVTRHHLVGGVAVGHRFGGTLGALTSRTFKFRWNDDAPVETHHRSAALRWYRFVVRSLSNMALASLEHCTSGLIFQAECSSSQPHSFYWRDVYLRYPYTLIVYRKSIKPRPITLC